MPGLYITNAHFKNSGVYECVAESTIHSTSSSATVTVTGEWWSLDSYVSLQLHYFDEKLNLLPTITVNTNRELEMDE